MLAFDRLEFWRMTATSNLSGQRAPNQVDFDGDSMADDGSLHTPIEIV